MIVFPFSFIKSPVSTFTMEVFTSVGTTTWVAPPNVTLIEYLVVGGGGGGGNGYDNAGGGGGGGGMVLTGTLSVTPGTSYTVTVGDGGIGGANARANNAGSPGQNSVFATITSLGGGNGFGSRTGGVAGVAQIGDTNAPTGGSGSGGGQGGKGGGGASGNGSSNSGATGGSGGSGISSSITGSAVTYGAGGAGANAGTQNAGVNGASNTGNGGRAGGAASTNSTGGGNGGSGIVVIKNLGLITDGLFVKLDASNYTSGSWSDETGNGNDATINGATWSSTNGGIFDFDGINDTISIAHNSSLSLSTSVQKTVQVWVKFDSLPALNNQVPVFGKLSSSYNFDGYWGGLFSNGGVVRCTTNGTSTQRISNSTLTITTNVWYLFTFISQITSTANTTKVYINTTEYISAAHGTDGYAESNPLYLGYIGSGVGSLFLDGKIGACYFYTKGLSLSDITTNYNATKTRYGL